jgi:hypothetical protein
MALTNEQFMAHLLPEVAKRVIRFDGHQMSLGEFLRVNLLDEEVLAGNVENISIDDTIALCKMEPGETLHIPVHFGYEAIQRVA